ncbi:MAG: 1D-myo-inositol 2-acetamido-2-deoxy-alpha-D-glucopyranoside deacetylase [Phycisphaerae bacterium]|nr:1D-myo-inositol 2-acetamido-2-deoxy-alpha-D-glucopyranoside deacetylase [Phycisphaerae bacterium]
MADSKLRILCIGAHPDDCEVCIGGTAALWAAAGHTVCFVSATNGETGHHEQAGAALVTRRLAEARASADVLGVQSLVLPIPNGRIVPSLEYRAVFIKLIREFAPNLILTNRPNDYHPDHRYTSQLVQDAAYIVTVPNNAPETPPLRYNPVIAWWPDTFRKPTPFQPDVVVDIGPTVRKKYDALHRHTSQMYEWIPWNQGVLEQVPAGEAARRAWLFDRRSKRDRELADRFRDGLVARYGPKRGQSVQYAEAFEGCEYGAPLDAAAVERFFGGL